ncbi:hypothetical protein NCCP2222_35740 [Sporosarcina sp. NCCP-2222]|uniref:hypothetical protein n=1 Tax=Sporosarcina sp. NCCP-2222 TaxID=2935073 RepID=UPI0020804A61|nr:hypothetical protein [Sporosarcina sp. NCCP-2222]GKV57627.1 hypothetical protein NCCP2222_35740 [Sporosarcina sp. NCCP-2222]
MKRLLSIGGMLCVSLWLVPSLVHGEEVSETKQKLKSPGLVSSLLDGVGKTADGTVQSVNNLVETTVDAVDQTVQDTSIFVTETVVPGKMTQDEPMSGQIQRTAELVDKTAQNVTPVVKYTTGTLKKTVAEVNNAVEELPNIPIAKPVAEAAGRTVDETVASAEDVVNTTVSTANQTAQDTIRFSSTSVKALVNPQSDKPVVDLLNGAGSLAGSTVSNVKPVLESTTATVQTAVSGVNETAEQLPEVPVVKPVAEELVKTVEETVNSADGIVFSTVDAVDQTVQDTVTMASNTVGGLTEPKLSSLMDLTTDTEILLHSALSNVGSVVNETSNTLRTVLTGSSRTVGVLPVISANEKPDFQEGKTPAVSQNHNSAVVEMPAPIPEELINTEPGQQVEVIEPLGTTDQEVPTASSLEVSKQISFERQEKSAKALDMAEQSQSNDSINGTRIELKRNMEELSINQMATSKRQQNNSGRTLQDDGRLYNAPLMITGSTTSITSPMMFASGGSDVVPSVLTRTAWVEFMCRQQWLLADTAMYSQWEHAPPGQPPAYSPFLLENNN